MSDPLSSSGAVKRIVENAGLAITAYRDDMPKTQQLPTVTIDEEVATSPERHGDSQDSNGHHGESEQMFVHIWQAWRTDTGKPAETYSLARDVTNALRTAPPFLYGPDDAPTRVYGIRIDGRARLIEDEDNVVHTTLTITLRRDA